MIQRGERPARYTLIGSAITDAKLSLPALGLLVYLLSKPDNWKVSTNQLCTQFDCGKDYIYARLAELGREGYVTRTQCRVGGVFSGFDYTIHDQKMPRSPQPENPAAADSPETVFPDAIKPLLTNTDKKRTKTKKEKPAALFPGIEAEKKTTLREYLARQDAQGKQHLESDDPVYAYADRIHLPDEFITLAWHKFTRAYLDSKKKYVEWNGTFRNAVEGNWYHLWLLRENTFELTTVGMQTKRDLDALIAAANKKAA